ncbi:hypothetical protein KBY31_05300 [Ruegeria pomeroyi]|nr:hypothetical protein [Ruegeria pomeroyi]
MSERETEFPKLDEHLAEMRILQRNASAHHGFIKYLTTHPELNDKYTDSFTGHLVKLQIDSVISSSIMLVCSLWDRNGHSLPEFAKAVSDKADSIKRQRKKWRSEWTDEMLGLLEVDKRLAEFIDKVTTLANSQEISAIRVHRDEEIAHPLKGRSGQRRKYEKAHGIYEPAKYDDLINLLEKSSELVSDAISIWHFEVISHADISDWFQRYSETYWTKLPTFSEIE